jgi:hypothetical protein
MGPVGPQDPIRLPHPRRLCLDLMDLFSGVKSLSFALEENGAQDEAAKKLAKLLSERVDRLAPRVRALQWELEAEFRED